ncbi:tetratricopeptide repeat protein, partial [Pyxidicoccus fallax]|uniref:CHAT domain-containing protein n=1 Tax=Pyxidicoccus fallax TaxID=394095 RepID=UPI0014948CA4
MLLRGWLVVVALCCAARAATGEELPEARLREAQTAFDEANTLWDSGRYADAIARGEHALALREAVLGVTHPDVARSLGLLGSYHLRQGNPARAEPLLLRALAIQEAALGENSPDIAQTLTHLANLYPAQGFYERAESLYTRALAIRKAAFGENHPLVAESLNNLARLYQRQASYARAGPLFLRALAIQEATHGKNHPDVAQTLDDLAWRYQHQGFSARAEPLFVRALAIREAALGKNHPNVAASLWGLANLYRSRGLSARAEPLEVRALAIWEAAIEQNPPNVTELLIAVAGLNLLRSAFARAELFYERTLAVQEAAVGEHHPLIADTLYRLAATYELQGLYSRAEPLFLRALAIWEAALGKSHFLVAAPALRLGNLYLAQGLYARAEPLLERGLAIRQATFGEKSGPVALALGNLGTLYMAQGLFARAEPLFLRALASWEAISSRSNPYYAIPLSKLGNLYLAQGQLARAEPLLRRALAILEAAFGGKDPDVAEALHDLANLYSAQESYGRARRLYARGLAIREATFGKNSPHNVETLNQLAVAHLAQHRLAEALPLLTRAFAISEQRLRLEALGFSEAHMARFLQHLRTDEERLYALLRTHPDNADVRRLTLAAALLLKGRSVEESAHISRTIYRSLGTGDRATLERLQELRTQLAQLSLQGPGALSMKAHEQRLEKLAEQAATLETDLARRSAPLRELAALPPPDEIVDRVAAALPRDGALVEFISYVDLPLVPRPGTSAGQGSRPLRYLALVLFPDATIRFQDLGPAEPIDAAALRLRDALANRDADFRAPAQALYQLAFQSLRPLLGTTRRLFLSPDGQLALVPFAALDDGRRFLVDDFDFTYLPSGKHLLPRSRENAPPDSVVVLADPDFNTPLSALPSAREEALLSDMPSLTGEHLSTLRADLTRRAWAPTPLPGSRQEAEAIQRLIPQAQLFLGPEASRSRLLQLSPPGILHLATHGFFLDEGAAPPDARAVVSFGALNENAL